MKVNDSMELLRKTGEKCLVEVRYFDDERYFWTIHGHLRPESICTTSANPTLRLYACLEERDGFSQNPLCSDKDGRDYIEIPIKNISHIDPLVDFKKVEEVLIEYYDKKHEYYNKNRRRDICRRIKELKSGLDLE